MNAKYLAEIKVRCEAATLGPWIVRENKNFGVQSENKNIASCFRRENENFIAHARTDIPALLAEVKRLTAENATTTETLKQVAKKYVAKGKENATLKTALTELIQTGQYNFCELCGADCIDAGLDFVDEMSQCGCFKLHDSQKAQQTHETQEAEK